MYADILRAKAQGSTVSNMWFPSNSLDGLLPRRINPTREKLLDLHFLHPIAVFPNRSNSSFFLVPVIALLIPSIVNVLFSAITLVAMILPLLVIIGGISGYIVVVYYVTKQEKSKIPKAKIYLTIILLHLVPCVQASYCY